MRWVASFSHPNDLSVSLESRTVEFISIFSDSLAFTRPQFKHKKTFKRVNVRPPHNTFSAVER